MKKQIQPSVLITALLCLTALEAIALYKGIDGTLFSLIIAAIAGIAGWTMPQLKLK